MSCKAPGPEGAGRDHPAKQDSIAQFPLFSAYPKFCSGETGTLGPRHVRPHPPRCLVRLRTLRVHHIKQALRVLTPRVCAVPER